MSGRVSITIVKFINYSYFCEVFQGETGRSIKMSFVDNIHGIGFSAFFGMSKGLPIPLSDEKPINERPLDDEMANRFLNELINIGYSSSTIKNYKWCCNLIMREFSGGSKVEYYASLYSRYKDKGQELVIIRRWMLFDVYGILPSSCGVRAQSTSLPYNRLNSSMREVIDNFVRISIEKGKRNSTINAEAASLSCFLHFIQDEGVDSVKDIQETNITNYKKKTGCRNSLLTRIGKMLEMCGLEISALFPTKCSDPVKVYEGMTNEESDRLKYYLADMDSPMTLKERALATLAVFTGMRGSDIANLSLNDIDWTSRTINIVMLKTGEELSIPMIPIVCKALSDYILYERPRDAAEGLVFISSKKVRGHYSKVSPGKIMKDVLNKCNILGHRIGCHIIRHSIATQMVQSGAPIAVVSKNLGHRSPDSTLRYIASDIELMRECTLSVEELPNNSVIYGADSH